MDNFKRDFLNSYLKLGLGAMPKTDIDSLVMHLIDLYGVDDSGPLAGYSNQTVSERLRTPVSKIKRMRYDAALKFGSEIEVEAKGRLLAALSKASLEPEHDKITLIIEDTLAKNWLQGQLKMKQQIFDYSFNAEILKVPVEGLFQVLDSVFDSGQIEKFREGYQTAKKQKTNELRIAAFKAVAQKFAEGAAKSAGSGIINILKAHVGVQ
jgi:hypothetical protein